MPPNARLLVGVAIGYWVVPRLVVLLYSLPIFNKKA